MKINFLQLYFYSNEFRSLGQKIGSIINRSVHNFRFDHFLLSAPEMIMLKLLHFIWCGECIDPARQRDEFIRWHAHLSLCCFTNCTSFKTICCFWMMCFWLFDVFSWTCLCVRNIEIYFEFLKIPTQTKNFIFYLFLYFPSLRVGLRRSQRTIESRRMRQHWQTFCHFYIPKLSHWLLSQVAVIKLYSLAILLHSINIYRYWIGYRTFVFVL